MGLRDIKAAARKALDRGMRVAALCYTAGPSGAAVDVFCRVHSKDDTVGDLAGTSLAYAERAETIPKLVFWLEDHQPARGNVYVISDTEAYRVETLEPIDNATRTAACQRLSPDENAQYAAPGAP